MAAGLATIKHLRAHPEIYTQIDKCSAQLKEGVLNVARKHGIALCANRVGSMLTWFFQQGHVHDWDTAAKSDTQAFAKFHNGMLERGVYLPPSQYEALFVSAAHSAEDIARTIEAAGGAFSH
jgi:glutamate-1-semialdehyde 2,1-aminomutase